MNTPALRRLAALSVMATLATSAAVAAPTTLDGLGQVGQWTDFERLQGEMPANPWGNSDTLHADRVGIFVEYANGLTGSATYSGVANGWGGCCNLGGGFPGIAPDTATGFFVGTSTGYAGLHGLDNNGFILPMAWVDLANQFTSNFDISYEEWGNSTWRADLGGWTSVTITLYSSAGTTNVPEPTSWVLAAAALAGLALARRRNA